MKILLGTPTRREGSRESWRDTLRWTWDDNGKNYVRPMMSTPQGADAARSEIVEAAKQWGAEMVIMIDDDYTPLTPFHAAVTVAREAFSRGYAMVVSPSVSFSRTLLVWPPGKSDESGKFPAYPTRMLNGVPIVDMPVNLSEISWAGLSLAFINGADLSNLKVLTRKLDINGKPEGSPMYCIQSPTHGEDYSFCLNLRESSGRKLGVDTRLVGDHYKLKGQRSYPGGPAVEQIIMREAQKTLSPA